MKHLLTLFIILPLFSNAQISLEHRYSYKKNEAQIILFGSNGTKILVSDTGTSTITLYNTDYITVWKTLTPPALPNKFFSGWSLVSDNLFNLDNNVEYIATYWDSVSYQNKSIVVDESGATLFDLDSATDFSVHNINGQYKLFAGQYHDINFNYSLTTSIYSVPGTMPCGGCSLLGVEKPSGSTQLMSDPQPNPAKDFSVINYTLPQESSEGILKLYTLSGQVVKTASLNKANTSITLDIRDIPSGMYFYTITTQNGQYLTSRKLIKL